MGGTGGAGGHGGRSSIGPLFGYVAASIIFATLIYGLLFQVRHDNLGQCMRNNVFRVQFDHRAKAFDDIVTILIAARTGPDQLQRDDPKANSDEVRRLLRTRNQNIRTVPLIDCGQKFQKPWPFG